MERRDHIAGSGSRGGLETEPVIGLESGLMREVLHLEHHRGVGQRSQRFIEQDRVMSTPEIELSKEGPFVGPQRKSDQVGVVGENEFAVGAPPNVNLEGIGHGGRRLEAAEAVVRESGGPSPVTDDR
jgi:hypothetical protein